MLILTNTTDNLQVVLDSAITTNELSCYASFRVTTTTGITPQRSVLSTNGTTPVNIVGSPSASTERVLDYLSVYNIDVASAVVNVILNDNGTPFVLFRCTLGVGEKLEYVDGTGFRVMANTGSVKTSVNQGSSPVDFSFSQVVLPSNVSTTINANSDITGLSFPVVAGSMYYYRFTIIYNSGATATGSRFTINGPSTSILGFLAEVSQSATARTITNTNIYGQPGATNTASAVTNGNIALITGFVNPSVNGDIQAQFASETPGTAITALAGSFVDYKIMI